MQIELARVIIQLPTLMAQKFYMQSNFMVSGRIMKINPSTFYRNNLEANCEV